MNKKNALLQPKKMNFISLSILLAILLMAPLFSVTPTSLRENELVFSNESIITDHFPEIVPESSELPNDVGVDGYKQWLLDTHFTAETGTIDIKIGSNRSLISGTWLGADVGSGPTIFKGLEKIPSHNGKDDTFKNAFSSIKMRASLTGPSLHINFPYDPLGLPRIEAYEAIDSSLRPINPSTLGIQYEGGAVKLGTPNIVKQGHVGIGTINPEKELHIKGGDFQFNRLFGKVGSVWSNSNASNINLTTNQSWATFLTINDFVIPDGGLSVFIIGTCSIYINKHTEIETRLVIKTSGGTTIKNSTVSAFDFEGSSFSPVGSFINVMSYHLPAGTYDLEFQYHHYSSSGTPVIYSNNANILIYAIPAKYDG